jgi:hypothetical protein
MAMTTAEHQRLNDAPAAWRRWGPYLAERAWGTVREDYSEHGTAWDSFPHDHARSRAYRWNEDGLAGICDDTQTLCLAFAFWNGRDPILKERIFGLTGTQGNHGEDAKEYWFYEDSTPTHSWMRWRYFYPQAEFPYSQLVDENARRGVEQSEYELLDTGIFDDDRYWDIVVDYAKADTDDIVARVTVRNAGPADATLHVLPTLWFRNTWSWGLDDRKPAIVAAENGLVTSHHSHPNMRLSGDGSPQLLFCDNETNARRLWNVDGAPYPKDAINDHVVDGLATTNPAQTGTKAALWYQVAVAAGGTQEITLRLHRDGVALGTDPLTFAASLAFLAISLMLALISSVAVATVCKLRLTSSVAADTTLACAEVSSEFAVICWPVAENSSLAVAMRSALLDTSCRRDLAWLRGH